MSKRVYSNIYKTNISWTRENESGKEVGNETPQEQEALHAQYINRERRAEDSLENTYSF